MATRRLFLSASLGIPAALSAARPLKNSKRDLPTPALIVDLDAFEENVKKMAAHARASGRALRPHAKTHKSADIAKILIKEGAVGACAAKMSEAEALARGGVTGLLVTTAVIGRDKITRAVALSAKRRETIYSVDNAQNVRDLNEAAKAAGVQLNLAVDLWISGRTGILPGEPALGLAKAIDSLSNVRFAGLQAYSGAASHTVGFEKRTAVSREAMAKAVETRRMIEAAGMKCPLVTGGSTGTYNIDTQIDGMTEIQPGSFLFMDLDYNRIGGADGPVYRDFRNSLFVIATAISKPTDDAVIVDAGFKAFSTDRPFVPQCTTVEGLTYAWAGDEHGKVSLANASRPVNVGDRLEFVVPHCDPTVNLYDRIYGVRGDRVETEWRITARGMSQ